MIGGILKFLGGAGKGLATIVGTVLTVAGVVSGVVKPHDTLSTAVDTLVHQVPAVITAIGVILASFGIGRKAGVASQQ